MNPYDWMGESGGLLGLLGVLLFFGAVYVVILAVATASSALGAGWAAFRGWMGNPDHRRTGWRIVNGAIGGGAVDHHCEYWFRAALSDIDDPKAFGACLAEVSESSLVEMLRRAEAAEDDFWRARFMAAIRIKRRLAATREPAGTLLSAAEKRFLIDGISNG